MNVSNSLCNIFSNYRAFHYEKYKKCYLHVLQQEWKRSIPMVNENKECEFLQFDAFSFVTKRNLKTNHENKILIHSVNTLLKNVHTPNY